MLRAFESPALPQLRAPHSGVYRATEPRAYIPLLHLSRNGIFQMKREALEVATSGRWSLRYWRPYRLLKKRTQHPAGSHITHQSAFDPLKPSAPGCGSCANYASPRPCNLGKCQIQVFFAQGGGKGAKDWQRTCKHRRKKSVAAIAREAEN